MTAPLTSPPAATASPDPVDVAVIGAGQAGLAAGYFLARAARDVDRGRRPGPPPSFVLLDASAQPGGAWPHHWDSLRLFSPAEHSSLPGRPMPPSPGPGTPDAGHVVAYLADYEDRYGLPVRRGVRVTAVTHDAAASPPFTLRLEDGSALSTRAVVSATGSFTRPFVPALPGADRFGGTQRHSAAYRSPEAFTGRRVLVVGGGNSGAQIAADLLLAGVATTWATRRPPRFMPDDVDGRTLFDRASARVLGRSEARVGDLGDIVMVPSVIRARDEAGLHAVPAPTALTPEGVRWDHDAGASHGWPAPAAPRPGCAAPSTRWTTSSGARASGRTCAICGASS
ncbi:putative flavoprotein involved in K+ transport [Micrococcus sp. 140720015-1]